jgi:sialidase-1
MYLWWDTGGREQEMKLYVCLVVLVAVAAVNGGERVAFAQSPLPKGVERTLVLPPGDNNARNSEGDFIQLKDGRLLFVYTHFTDSGSDAGKAHLAGRHSSDGGLTWTTEDVLVLPNEGGQNVMSVSLLRLQNDEIALFYLRKNSDGDCRPYMRISADEAGSWGEAILCIEPEGYFVVNNDRVIQLESGRLVIPAACHCLGEEEWTGRGRAVCYLSDDNGRTWRRCETTLEAPEASKSGLQEPLVVELKDGRLMMLARTDQGCQMRSWSNDAGVTWSAPEMTGIMSPVSPASCERIPKTGDLLLVWNDHSAVEEALKGMRTPFNTAISRDEGKSWEKVKTLADDPNGWYCYTAIHFMNDHLLLGHCAGDRRTGGLNLSQVLRVGIDWLYE